MITLSLKCVIFKSSTEDLAACVGVDSVAGAASVYPVTVIDVTLPLTFAPDVSALAVHLSVNPVTLVYRSRLKDHFAFSRYFSVDEIAFIYVSGSIYVFSFARTYSIDKIALVKVSVCIGVLSFAVNFVFEKFTVVFRSVIVGHYTLSVRISVLCVALVRAVCKRLFDENASCGWCVRCGSGISLEYVVNKSSFLYGAVCVYVFTVSVSFTV